jgi:hypothetical protein
MHDLKDIIYSLHGSIWETTDSFVRMKKTLTKLERILKLKKLQEDES